MSLSPRETVLCHYHYDPLDRLADSTPFKQAGIQRFYCKTRLATEVQDAVQCSIFQHDDQLLAQQQSQNGKVDTTLLATDQQRSVLNALDATQPHLLAYTPYGHRPAENGLLSLFGFNGERPDPVTGHYHLGNGYRLFNPVLMRFNSPDSWSPFGEGGLNAYAYCDGDPRNRMDPDGHAFSVKGLLSFIKKPGFIKSSKKSKAANFLDKKEVPYNLKKNDKVTTVTSQFTEMKGRKITLHRDIHDSPFILQTKERVYLDRQAGTYSFGERRVTGVLPDSDHAPDLILDRQINALNEKIDHSGRSSISLNKVENIRKSLNLDNMVRRIDSKKTSAHYPQLAPSDHRGPRY